MLLTKEQKETYIALFNDEQTIRELTDQMNEQWVVRKYKDYRIHNDYPYELLMNNEQVDTFEYWLLKLLKNVLLLPQYKVGDKVVGIVRKYGRKVINGTITELSLNGHGLCGAWVSVRVDSIDYQHYLMPIEDIKHIEV